MKLSEAASWAEIVSAVGLVISLIYVGVSVRQNTDAITAANHQNLLSMDMEKNAWFRDREFSELYVSALSDIEELSPAQLRQFRTFVSDQINIWEYVYIAHESGLLNDTIWEGYNEFYSGQMKLPAYRFIWEQSKEGWTGGFAAHVESVLEDTPD